MQKIYTDTDIAEAQSNYDASKTAMDTSNTTYYRLKEHFEYSRRLLEEARVDFEKGLKVRAKILLRNFTRICWPVSMMSSSEKTILEWLLFRDTSKKTGLLYPHCAHSWPSAIYSRTSAGTVMAKFGCCLYTWPRGLYSLGWRSFTSMGIPIINLKRSDDRLGFIKGIRILLRRRLLFFVNWSPG